MKQSSKIFILLLFFSGSVYGKQIPGYIINNQADTVYGYIRITSVIFPGGAICLNGFNTEPLYYEVHFKSPLNKRFKRYEPTDIKEFSFIEHNEHYVFRSFDLRRKNLFSKNDECFRFLRLVIEDDVSLFNNLNKTYYSSNRLTDNGLNAYTIQEYFLYDNFHGLSEVCKTTEYSVLKDLLKKYNFDNEYIRQLPDSKQYMDIYFILSDYKRWKSVKDKCRIKI